MNPRQRPRGRALLHVLTRVPGCLALLPGLVPALVPGLLLYGAGPSSAAAAAPAGGPVGAVSAAGAVGAARAGGAGAPRMLPLPPSGAVPRGAGAPLVPGVNPGDTKVAQAANGDFTVSVANTGSRTVTGVRILLDDALPGNAVGSSDGRCLGRLDPSSPADLWCEVGAVPPGGTAAVRVHAYMNQCVGGGPADPRTPPAAFTWRVAYLDAGLPYTVDGPAPTWSCTPADTQRDSRPDPVLGSLDTAEARQQP